MRNFPHQEKRIPVGSSHQDRLVYQEVVDIAAKKFFAIIGVDIEKPESVEEFREDLRFSRKLRRAANHGFLVFVGLVVAGIVTIIGAGILSRLGVGH